MLAVILKSGSGKRVRDIFEQRTRLVLLHEAVIPCRVNLSVELPPTELLGHIAAAKINRIDSHRCQVQVGIVDVVDRSVWQANDSSRELCFVSKQELGIEQGNLVPFGDFRPINICSKSVGPAPPTMVRVGATRRPDRPCVVAIGIFRFEIRVSKGAQLKGI